MTIAAHDPYRLSGAWNFRDIGGLRTADGTEVRPGVLYRSSQLAKLDDDGRATLLDLGVTDVFDLRRAKEIAGMGADAVPAEVRLHNTPFEPDEDPAGASEATGNARPPHERPTTPERAFETLREAYAAFAVADEAAVAIHTIARTVADGPGAVLVHCAAGKDRTGWLIAVLLRAVGVTDADIRTDYLLSNEAVPDLTRTIIEALGSERAVLHDELLGVRDAYYDAAEQAILDKHGSFPAYLAALGIDDALVARLRVRLLG